MSATARGSGGPIEESSCSSEPGTSRGRVRVELRQECDLISAERRAAGPSSGGGHGGQVFPPGFDFGKRRGEEEGEVEKRFRKN